MTRRDRGLLAVVLGGLLVAVVVGVVLSAFAASEPDGLESAVVKTQCAEAPDPEACLEEAAGEPVYTGAPLPDYEITWLSGLLGVIVSFVLGAGLVALLRRGRQSTPGTAAHSSRG
ncbi:MAG TPA: PDGLE domain-containing protein [Egibacteraceae bacterium]